MHNKILEIESQHLGKTVEMPVYGHFGSSILLFSSTEDDPYENERNGIIESILPFIKKGIVTVYSIATANKETWEHSDLSPAERSKKHFDYNNFIIEEVLPLIYDNCGNIVPIITAGASKGAYHALNTYFRRPDLFIGTIAMSGKYDIYSYTHGYWDDNCYFNSPVHYLPNLNDNYWLAFLKSRHHVYLLSGRGLGEDPSSSYHLSSILAGKEIPHTIDIWGEEWGHNAETWKSMISHIIKNKI